MKAIALTDLFYVHVGLSQFWKRLFFKNNNNNKNKNKNKNDI